MRPIKTWVIILVYVVLITLPFLIGFISGGENYIFGGFLLNPIDGNSYLAKMQLGVEGKFIFHLPYSVEQGNGAYLFLFYIILGAIAGGLNLSPVLVFHLARIASGLFLLFSLVRFTDELFAEFNPGWNRRAFLMILFGSGLGWLVFLFGSITSDVWVAEGYPFLSSYANPHFPLGIGLLIWIFMLSARPPGRRKLLILPLSLLLSIILPFGVVIAGVVLVLNAVWAFLESRSLRWQEIVLVGTGGGIFVIYQYAATMADPILAAWNNQNQTPAPSILDFIISFSPALLFAFVGAWFVLKNQKASLFRYLVLWLAAGILLTYLPINLQRRFLTGFYIPAGALAVVGIYFLNQRKSGQTRIFQWVFSLSLPTLLVVLMIGWVGIQRTDPNYYLSRFEISGFQWLKENIQGGSIVIAAPQTGLYIPAYTPLRVIYGHPFETILASERKQELETFFSNRTPVGEEGTWLLKVGAQAVFWGPREWILGKPAFIESLTPAFHSGDVEIYLVSR